MACGKGIIVHDNSSNTRWGRTRKHNSIESFVRQDWQPFRRKSWGKSSTLFITPLSTPNLPLAFLPNEVGTLGFHLSPAIQIFEWYEWGPSLKARLMPTPPHSCRLWLGSLTSCLALLGKYNADSHYGPFISDGRVRNILTRWHGAWY